MIGLWYWVGMFGHVTAEEFRSCLLEFIQVETFIGPPEAADPQVSGGQLIVEPSRHVLMAKSGEVGGGRIELPVHIALAVAIKAPVCQPRPHKPSSGRGTMLVEIAWKVLWFYTSPPEDIGPRADFERPGATAIDGGEHVHEARDLELNEPGEE